MVTPQPAQKRVAILGAGPAGLGLALRLLRRPALGAEVVVIEQAAQVGGLAGSFESHGLSFDYGSHRLHPATSPEILADIRALLGDELLDRPRYGRILLQGRFVRFPLQPVDLMLHLPPAFVAGFLRDVVLAPWRKWRFRHGGTFAEVLLRGLGSTMCRSFYFPYARKVWGLEPEEIDAVQAQRRVAASNTGKLIKKALSLLPGLRGPGAGRFYYPRRGYGQISQALAAEVQRLGGRIMLNTRVASVRPAGDVQGKVHLQFAPAQGVPQRELEADFVFSTIPLTVLVSLLQPQAALEVRDQAEGLRYRSMLLLYLVLRAERFSPYDAHYLPEEKVLASRLSEPKNYSGASEPRELTGLCAEIPCTVGDALWQMSDQELASRLLLDLDRAGLPVRAPIVAAFSRRVSHAYPVYNIGFAERLAVVERYLATVPRVISLGRQGLFAHDNTHHTLEMAYRAADCLGPDLRWDEQAWQLHREAFAKHVVED
ncbi:MAG: FAD-dependent oxidoreductase [bacterium]|jgi:protoporphyrinogen oxidase|nr:FAD-dependent oxidoreductase [candidate division KSB1 bacterium]MDH7559932.1 FAD-dependent oxidoreductase [bacterium]